MWKEIEEFAAAGDYERFIQYIGVLITKGEVVEVDLDPETIKMSGYRWFQQRANGEVWCLYPPDGTHRGAWKKAALDARFMNAR